MTAPLAGIAAALAGRYRVEGVIGAGGMATVYAAHDLRHDRAVAIKVLRQDLAASIGPQRFLAEIRTTAKLQHPNILPLFDSGEADGLLYFVMPLVTGETLRQRMQRDGTLPLPDAIRITGEVLSALDHAHHHGVIHRDIKPENILLQDDRAMLADFGIALGVTSTDTRLTTTGMAMGTPAYMSPEQALGERTVDARTDIYAVGTMLYEMLTGVAPFTGASAQAVVAKLLTQDASPPSRHDHAIPESIDQAILIALRKDPRDRFATAADFQAALRDTSPLPRPVKRQRRRLAGAAASVLSALAIAGAWLAIRHQAGPGGPRLIAILPFTNESGDTTNTALGEGLPIEIYEALHRLHLNVVPTSSAFAAARRFTRGPDVDVDAVGHALQATAVLSGRFQQAGSAVRINIELDDVRKHAEIWSRQYDGSMNLFALEDSVSLGVANELRVTLTPAQLASFRVAPTTSPEVHALVVRAKGYTERRERASLRAAISLLDAAIALDSNYAPAWAALAGAHTLFAIYDFEPPEPDFIVAERAADRALALDDGVAETHTILGVLHVFHDRDFVRAAMEFDRAFALDSTDPSTFLYRGWYYVGMGQMDSATASMERGLVVDPGSAVLRARLGTVLYLDGKYADAERELHDAVAVDSGNMLARRQLAQLDADDGQCALALADVQQLPPTPGQFEGAFTPYIYARCGRAPDARRTVDTLEQMARRGEYVAPFAIAMIYGALGDTARTYHWLDLAVDQHVWQLFMLPYHPAFGGLRAQAHFRALLERARPVAAVPLARGPSP